MKALHMVSFTLLIIGGLNWLLIGLFNYDLVGGVFSFSGMLVRLIYILVGLSAVYLIFTHKKSCKECMSMKSGEQM